MRSTRTTHGRTAACAALVVGVLGVPVSVAAAPLGDPSVDVIASGLLVGQTAPSGWDAQGDHTEQDADDDRVELGGDDLPGLERVEERCREVLLTATPTQVTGDASAVAITSQAIDRDVEGWLHVSWEALAGTVLTDVSVRTPTGIWSPVGAIATGSASDVLEITFCGTSTAATGSGAEDTATTSRATGTAGTAGTAGATGTTGTEGGTGTTGPIGTTGTTSSGSGTAAVVATPEPGTAAEPSGDGTDVGIVATGADDDPDVEVLGVQLSRSDAPTAAADRPGRGPLVASTAALAALIGAAMRWRRRTPTTPAEVTP
jgi:hypothetical protein